MITYMVTGRAQRAFIQTRSDGTRDTSLLELGDFFEAFRVINIRFSIKEVIPNSEYPLRPTLKFQGDIEGMQTMVGNVFMTKDQTIRWHFVSTPFLILAKLSHILTQTSGEEDNMIWRSVILSPSPCILQTTIPTSARKACKSLMCNLGTVYLGPGQLCSMKTVILSVSYIAI